MENENLKKAIYHFPRGMAFVNTSTGQVIMSSGSFEEDDDGDIFDSINRDYVYLEGKWLKALSYEELNERN